jgi:hypothetical protein
MARTEVRSAQIKDATIGRDDLNTATAGQAVVAKIVAGAGVTLSSTGADTGTGDVTVSDTLATGAVGTVLAGGAPSTYSANPAVTSITAPTVVGGTGTTSTLTLKPTSGAGTTGADVIVGVGTNGATEVMRVTSASPSLCVSGNLALGTATPGTDRFLLTGSTPGASRQIVERTTVGVGGPNSLWRHTRGGSALVNGDSFGTLSFMGDTGGSVFGGGVQLTASVDGTVSASSMPGLFTITTTPDGSLVGVERLRIDNAGVVTVATKLVAPTPAPGTNTTEVATTSFVATSFAPLASPALTGTPTVPTAAAATNTTQAASTAFVQQELDYVPTTAWTPTFSGSTTAGTATYSTRNGSYLKIKKLVHFTVDITLTSTGGAAGIALITGLPYTVGGTAQSGFDITYISGVTQPAGCTQFTAVANPGTTTIVLAAVGSGAVANTIACTAVAATAIIRLHGFYFI